MRDILAETKFIESAVHFAKACAASRMHQDLAIESIKRYGDHGPSISGIVRDHFPEDVKNTLRMLGRRICEESDKAWLARPAYVRSATMRKLASAIAKRDGAGFYGPQPDLGKPHRNRFGLEHLTGAIWREQAAG